MTKAGFFGREDELGSLDALAPRFDVVSISGPGGVGKSRLAFEWSSSRSRRVVNVASAGPLDVAVDDAFTRPSPSVVVLDDCDAGLAELAELLPMHFDDDVTIVTTSRRKPEFGYEGVLQLGPLSVDAAVALLQWHLSRRGLPPAPADVAAHIADRLDGFPVLIEAAASDAELLGVRRVAERLERHGFSAVGADAGLAELLLSSADDLSSDAQRALAASSVFADGFDVESMAAVAELEDALPALRELSRGSLVHRVDSSPPRFATFGVVREAAAATLADRGPLLERHARRFVEGAPEVTGRTQAYAERWQDELHAVIDRAARGSVPAELGVRAMALAASAPTPDAARIARAVELVRSADDAPPGSTAVCVAAAQVALRGGERARALELLDEADDVAATALDTVVILNARGAAERVRGANESALDYYRQALAAVSDLDARWMEGRLRANLAAVLWEMGERGRAHEEMDRALAIHRADGDVRSEGFVLGNRGVMYHHEGDLGAARRFHLEALERHRECGHRRYEAIALFDLGALEHEQGALRAALRQYYEGLEIFVELGDRRLAALAAAAVGAARAGLALPESGELGDRLEGDVFDGAIDLYDELARRYRAIGLDGAALEPFEVPDYAEETDEVMRPARLLDIVTTANSADCILCVTSDSACFRAPGGDVVDVEHRASLRGILASLVDGRLDGAPARSPGELIAAGWPGETIDPSAALNRLHVALSTLRKLGLRDVLVTTGEGHYRLDPEVLVVIAPQRISG